MKRVWLGFVAASLSSATPAAAQIMSNPSQWYINNQIYSMRAFNDLVANSMHLKGAKNGARPNPANPGGPSSTANPTSFTEAASHSLPKRLAEKAGGGVQNQQQAQQLFDSFITLYKQTAQKDGFPSNDLAYAFEYFVVNNYHIYHDLMNVPYEKDPRAKRGKDGFDRIAIMSEKKLLQVSIAQERIIYNQFRTILGANAGIQQMTDAQKQEATELMAVMFGVNYTAYMKGINEENDATMEQARQMAKEGLEKLLGVPVTKIKISSNGLEL